MPFTEPLEEPLKDLGYLFGIPLKEPLKELTPEEALQRNPPFKGTLKGFKPSRTSLKEALKKTCSLVHRLAGGSSHHLPKTQKVQENGTRIRFL